MKHTLFSMATGTRLALRFALPASLLSGLLLAGCDLFGGGASDPFEPKPATLHPESDAFAGQSSRIYYWKESLRRTDGDSLLGNLSLEATRGADTIVDGDTFVRIDFTPLTHDGPVPVATVTRLGFRPGHMVLDTLAVPDPGPDLPFPETPSIGWRLDTAIGDLRFVRVLRGVEVVRLVRRRYECWAFAESTWHAGTLMGAGSTWMGRSGLVRHRSEWTNFMLSAGPSGSLFREITAP